MTLPWVSSGDLILDRLTPRAPHCYCDASVSYQVRGSIGDFVTVGGQERGKPVNLPALRANGLARRREQLAQMRERRQWDEIQVEQAQLHHG